jgi:hypothetical protein
MPGQPESETRELLCELNTTELLQRGETMADAELRIEQWQLKRGTIGDKIKAERALRRKLAGIIDTGTEMRDVRCVWIEKFEQNCFELVRQDTGAVIDTRAMTAKDRQVDLLGAAEEVDPTDELEGDDEGDEGDGDDDPEEADPDDLEAGDDDPPARKHLDTEPEHLDA